MTSVAVRVPVLRVLVLVVWFALSLPCTAQERLRLEDMGWSCEPPPGWSAIDRRTLNEIGDDLRYALGSAQVRAGYALREPGALPRMLINIYPVELVSHEAAQSLMASLGGSGDLGDGGRLEFSARSSMAHEAGEVFVLSHGWAGARGLVQVVVYSREPDMESSLAALEHAVLTARLDDDARVPADQPPVNTAASPSQSQGSRLVGWAVRGAIIGAMVAVILFGIRFLRAMWAPGSAPPEG